MVFPPLATYIITHHGWQNCLRIFAGLHLICSFCSLSYGPLTDHKENNDEYSNHYSNNNQYIVKEEMKIHVNKSSEDSNFK